MARGPIGTAGAVIGWIIVAAAVFAIMVLWDWDPLAFLSNALERLSNWFLGWEWFRNIVGAP